MDDRLHQSDVRRKRVGLVIVILFVASVFQVLGANPAAPQSPALLAYRATSPVHLDPDASAWRRAPKIDVALTAQQAEWPFGGSVPMVEARALHDDGMLYIRLQWRDTSRDDDVSGVRSFVDAAAVEFPATAATSVPAICMGQADNGVNIWHWRAGSAQGLPSSITELSVNGYVDLYPSTDELYFPARAAGNIVSQPRAVQDLVAQGFGRLDAAVDQDVQGAGIWKGSVWSVVFGRELTNDSEAKISLGEGMTSDLAFAVWNGHNDERNGSKSISAFVSLQVVGRDAPKAPRTDRMLFLILAGSLTTVVGLGAAVLSISNRIDP